jgi:hypothetical protein
LIPSFNPRWNTLYILKNFRVIRGYSQPEDNLTPGGQTSTPGSYFAPTFVFFKKLAKVSNRPLDENSPNLVTLAKHSCCRLIRIRVQHLIKQTFESEKCVIFSDKLPHTHTYIRAYVFVSKSKMSKEKCRKNTNTMNFFFTPKLTTSSRG